MVHRAFRVSLTQTRKAFFCPEVNMNFKKPVFFTEAASLIGVFFVAMGTALMEAADMGLSMISAPAYILFLKLSETFPALTFGTVSYCFEALLLALLCLLLRKFRVSYLMSFFTAFLFGVMLDFCIFMAAPLPRGLWFFRLIYFLAGMLFCACGVALLFHTYIPPEVYELIVKEVSANFNFDIHKTKNVYDISSTLLALVFSFLFFGFGHFVGIKWGTFVSAVVNAKLIKLFSDLFEAHFSFRDGVRKRDTETEYE